MLVSWNWLKEYLGETELTATQAAELLGMHAFELEGIDEQPNDTIIDVDILPNRSSDCLCHRGVARELASITGVPLASDPLSQTVDLPAINTISVSIEDSNACPRFAASLITSITVAESPQWLKDRLEAIGQRPINNIVDATNYVMFAIGQPIHAYDAELFPQVEGAWQFVVRYARAGEEVSLIPEGGKEEDRVVVCQGTELLIVDGSSDTPIGLAGVKGGRFAGVHEATTQVIVETAHFHPTLTRKTARRLGIVIDASKRFENEPSRELIPYTQAEITKLICDIASGTLEGVVDIYLEEAPATTVVVDPTRVNVVLGLDLPIADMVMYLERAGVTVVEANGLLQVTNPFERTDLQIQEDYIEEIGRLHGYEHVATVAPTEQAVSAVNARHYYAERTRETLVQAGFSEVITSSFRKKDQVQLRNALASDKSYLRSSLIKNTTEVLDKNVGFTDLLGTTDTRVFELGTVFHSGEGEVQEHIELALGIRLKPAGYSGKEDKLLAEYTKLIEETLDTTIDWTIEKGIATCNFTSVFTALPVPIDYDRVTMGAEIAYQPFSSYQHMSRDVAMWVDGDATPEEVEAVLNDTAGDLRVRTTLVDTFEKDGRTSLAFRLVFQSKEKTLTDSEVNGIMDAIYAAVSERGWEVR